MFGRLALRVAPKVARSNIAAMTQVRAFSFFLDPKETTQRVMDVLSSFEKIDKSKITPTAHFNKDLGLDSLDAVEVVLAIEDEFNIEISDEQSDKIQSVEDAVKCK